MIVAFRLIKTQSVQGDLEKKHAVKSTHARHCQTEMYPKGVEQWSLPASRYMVGLDGRHWRRNHCFSSCEGMRIGCARQWMDCKLHGSQSM